MSAAGGAAVSAVVRAAVRASGSEGLKARIALVDPRLQALLARFWDHPRFEVVLPLYMTRLYHAVHASVPLLTCARDRASELADRCNVARELVPYFDRHIDEERGHDEWLLEDLAVLGADPDSVRTQTAPLDVAVLVGTQYYAIRHEHPLSMLAYLAVIECNPPRAEALDVVVERSGIPRAAMRSFYRHAEFDIGHSEDIWRLVDALPLLPWHRELMGLTVFAVTDQLADMLERTLECA